ncbi:MAG: hypothetical protein M0T82_05245 [Desulfobacteraceae bacterium]|nr:hypothetical protein [Desulfobacteraceae bacterium]
MANGEQTFLKSFSQDYVLPFFESEHKKSNPFAVWQAIDTCNQFGLEFPSWVKNEINRIASSILKLENPGKNYPEHLAEILKMKGKPYRRKEEKAVRDGSITFDAIQLIRSGRGRKEALEILSNKHCLNQRDIETIFDKAKKWDNAAKETLDSSVKDLSEIFNKRMGIIK